MQDNEHLLSVCRYVERNALRVGLVCRAEDWRWGSLWRYVNGNRAERSLLSPWPVRRSGNWVDRVNEPQTEAELASLRRCIQRGSPFGNDDWTTKAITRFNLEATIRPRGRPKKEGKGS